MGASPQFFNSDYRKEKFINQNKENMKNFVKQIKQISFNPDSPNEVRYFMQEIKTLREYADGQFYPSNLLSFLFKNKKEIMINLKKMAKYFDKLVLKISCCSNFSNEYGIYFLKLPTGQTIVMSQIIPRYVSICFKTLRISFCWCENNDERSVLHRCPSYEFVDGFLRFSVNSFYKLTIEIIDFELQPIKI